MALTRIHEMRLNRRGLLMLLTMACLLLACGLATSTFAQDNQTLTVVKQGNGADLGFVSSDPFGIVCGPTCIKVFPNSESVTLSPTRVDIFESWGGCDSVDDTTKRCEVALNTNKTVTITYTVPNKTLTVTKSGPGTDQGTVTSAPAGIDCGDTCEAEFGLDSNVTLVVTPTVLGVIWQPCDELLDSNVCRIDMSDDRTVDAQLSAVVTELTVAKSGIGKGTVTSSPGTIDCSPDCTEPVGQCAFECGQAFDFGTSVTLTAVPEPGSDFTGGWSGCDTVSGNTCTVAMTLERTVTARFDEEFDWNLFLPAILTGDLNLPSKPVNPLPADGAVDQSTSTVISWENGGLATSYDVYFGTNPTPTASEFVGNQTTNVRDPGTLSNDTIYFWRIDSKNANGTTTGDVWQFRTSTTRTENCCIGRTCSPLGTASCQQSGGIPISVPCDPNPC